MRPGGSWTGRPAGCKVIRISLETDGERITSIKLNGDFFAHPEEAFERLEASLRGESLDRVEAAVRESVAREGITLYGITAEGIAEAARRALDETQAP